jgi:ATP-binding cassette subfamily B (MDR/TAP) protein 1
MAGLNDTKPPPPPTSSVEAEAVVLESQVIEVATLEKDRITEDAEKQDAEPTVKKADGGFASYIVSIIQVRDAWMPVNSMQRVFKYGTAFDYFLMILCCLTSAGSGVVGHPIRPMTLSAY